MEERPLCLAGNGTPRALRCRVLQSPLAGVSDPIFRALVRRWAPVALLLPKADRSACSCSTTGRW